MDTHGNSLNRIALHGHVAAVPLPLASFKSDRLESRLRLTLE